MESALIEVLQRAGSQDPTILKSAEVTLKEWETQRGFYVGLYNVFSNHSLAIDVRWMAILYFKNGIDKYWRKTAQGAIAEDEKEFLRQRLLVSFEEPVNQIAMQLAVVIAKIARSDCLKQWGTLVPTLLDAIRGQNSLAQHRALLILYRVVKTLAAKCLPLDQQLFQELTMNMFNFILHLWNTYTESFLIMASNGGDAHQIQETLEKALFLLRILRRLLCRGCKEPSKSPDAMMFVGVIIERARTCLECRKTLTSHGIQMEMFDKFIIQLTKILIGFLEWHAVCFVELIPACLEFSVFYCFTEAGQALTFERFTIQCLNLIKGILLSPNYRITVKAQFRQDQEATSPAPLRAHQLSQQFFTPQTLREICSRLVTHYFLLTPSDLELWDSDVESFAIDDAGESWKYCLRPCTESVFLVIFRHFRGVLASVLVDLMQQHHQPVDPNNLHAILLKDAVYNAFGLAAFDLYDEVDFDQWFSTTLKQELKIPGNNYRIIRRRVCWLIRNWISVKFSAKLRPALYKLMIEALNPEEDLGVRLAASDALKYAIDDIEFNPIDFSPYLEAAFPSLLSLLKEVKQCDTMMHVLYVLSTMIEHVRSGIKSHMGSLSIYLPHLWQYSAEHSMLRCAIVSTLVNIVNVLGPESVALHPMIIGVVDLSCDATQDSHVYLVEEGLQLWLTLLKNAPAPTPAIMDLFRIVPLLLEQSIEHLRLCLHITKAYALLSPEEFLNTRGRVLIETLMSLIGDLRAPDEISVKKLLQTILIVQPQQGAELIKPLLPKIIEDVVREYPCYPIKILNLAIIARVLLISRDIFEQGITEAVRAINSPDVDEASVLHEIRYVWIDEIPGYDVDTSKLFIVALFSTFGAQSPENNVLKSFSQIMVKVVDILDDMRNNPREADFVIINDHPGPPEYGDPNYFTEHKQRKFMLAASDPIHSISFPETIQNQLLMLRRIIGNIEFDQLMLTLDSETDKELRDYINL